MIKPFWSVSTQMCKKYWNPSRHYYMEQAFLVLLRAHGAENPEENLERGIEETKRQANK